MRNATHTPGPWEAGDEYISGSVAVWSGDRIVALVGGKYADADQCRVDARLIAAATEMLEALIWIAENDQSGEMVYTLSESGPSQAIGRMGGEISKRALAAIAKAKGGAA